MLLIKSLSLLLLQEFGVDEQRCSDIANKTEHFSGSDLYQLCKECAMRSVPDEKTGLISFSEYFCFLCRQTRPLRRLLDKYYKDDSCKDIEAKISPIELDDIDASLKCCKSTGHVYSKEYDEFTAEYGS